MLAVALCFLFRGLFDRTLHIRALKVVDPRRASIVARKLKFGRLVGNIQIVQS